LFNKLEQNSITLDDSITHDISQVLDDENTIMTVPFTVDEAHEAIFHMEYNKAPGLDGFPAEFYQIF
jgi:hypothetical protein